MNPSTMMHTAPPAATPGAGRWGQAVAALLQRWRGARALARAEAELRAMDVRVRRDLGLGDGEAHAAARDGRGPRGGYGDWPA